MNPAIIAMTILGCDDAVKDCQYIATLQQRWPSIEMCNSVSEQQLASFANVSYPVVIAVCQDPRAPETADNASPQPNQPDTETAAKPPETEEQKRQEERGMAARAISRVTSALPSSDGIRTLFGKPVRLVENSYSWVAKKFRD
ncbi:hypothetical protein GAO09_00810 [Rhizobiales bacterium RZME27]|jgi:hypothetical protein|uniref:Uncharacterized protein n=1 Tax=Endobacterium cereale TaxID=2663029 RepID=A0A6A8A169_9HYPH|nr:hypothetical protein [Endobacterium cereale]MEB2843499.1 hypothetical protein [Endobacterium cereale]MQY44615.1 hypothetical protein [Endobacterium cereale]